MGGSRRNLARTSSKSANRGASIWRPIVHDLLKMYYALELRTVIFYSNTYNNDEMALTMCTELF